MRKERQGTVLPAGEAAIVSTGRATGVDLLLPDYDTEELVPPLIMAMMACALRLHSDPEFLADQVHWLLLYNAEPEGDA